MLYRSFLPLRFGLIALLLARAAAAAPTTCSPGDLCNDGDPCTTDSCIDTTCQHVQAADGTICTPGEFMCANQSPDSAPADSSFVCRAGVCNAFNDSQACVEHLCDPRGDLSVVDVPVAGDACCANGFDHTIATTVLAATKYLYTCPHPLQVLPTGSVPPDALRNPGAVSAVHGVVKHASGSAVPGIHVSVVGRPELGYAISRADGAYDLAVTGGGPVTLAFSYVKVVAGNDVEPYVPLQRTVFAAPNRHVFVDPVIMTERSGITRTLTAGGWVDGWVTLADDAPQRNVSAFMPIGTGIKLVHPDGTSETLASGTLLVTELTARSNGGLGMPSLPPTSSYTYAADVSLSEAIAIGGRVELTGPPLVYYVDGVVVLPAGTVVPAGYYDPDTAAWIPATNGIVVGILTAAPGSVPPGGGAPGTLGTSPGTIDLGGATPDSLGITSDELLHLTSNYPAGATVWRVPLPHLSVWDFNYGAVIPSDAIIPPEVLPPLPDTPTVPTCTGGSIIGCEAQTLAQVFPVTGASFDLRYQSDRGRGYLSNNRISFPLFSGSTFPKSLLGVQVTGSVGGTNFTQTFDDFTLNTTTVFNYLWNGVATDGTTVEGIQRASVDLTYVYSADYILPAQQPGVPAFGSTAGSASTVKRDGTSVDLSRHFDIDIGNYHAVELGLGALTPTSHHRYDVGSQTVWYGDGRRLRATSLATEIRVLDDQAKLSAAFYPPCPSPPCTGELPVNASHAAFGPDGALHVVFGVGYQSIYTLGDDGALTFETGTSGGGDEDLNGDGGLATDGELLIVRGIAFGPDGSLFIAEDNRADPPASRVRHVFNRVNPTTGVNERVIDTFVGGSQVFKNADGHPRSAQGLSVLGGIAVGPDGAIYVTELSSKRVYRYGADGESDPVVVATFAEDPHAIVIGRDSALYVALGETVQRVDLLNQNAPPAAYVGGGTTPPTAADVRATDLKLLGVGGLAINSRGELIVQHVTQVGDGASMLIRVDAHTAAGEMARQIAGTGSPPDAPDCEPVNGGVALLACFGTSSQIAVDAFDNIIVPTFDDGSLLRVGSSLGGFSASDILIADARGSVVYEFDGRAHPGRHIRTLDGVRRSSAAQLSNCGHDPLPAGSPTVVSEFCYVGGPSDDGRLSAIIDRDGRATTFDYASPGAHITSPDGQITTLTIDAGSRNVTAITDPAAKVTGLAYLPNTDLLSSMTDRDGHTYTYDYDAATGTLLHDVSPAEGTAVAVAFKTLSRTPRADGKGWTTAVTEPNPETPRGTATTTTTTHSLTYLPGSDHQVTTYPDGTSLDTQHFYDGSELVTDPAGTKISTHTAPDPRFGMQAPYVASKSVTITMNNIDTSIPDPTPTVATWTNTLATNAPDGTWNTLTATRTDPDHNEWTTVFDRNTNTFTTTSPLGRVYSVVIDEHGRVTNAHAQGVTNDVNIAYDETTGRALMVEQGRRVTKLAYFSATGTGRDGFLHTLTDPLHQVTTRTSDALDRTATLQRADDVAGAHLAKFLYDNEGDTTSVKPFGAAAHTFGYNAEDLLTSYTPPMGAGETGAIGTTAQNDSDRRVSEIDRPDGLKATQTFDAMGRPATVTLPRTDGAAADAVSLGYNSSGQVSSALGPDGSVSFGYSNALQRQIFWSGNVNGKVIWAFDDQLRPKIERAGGGTVVDVAATYDADGLPAGNADFVIHRGPNGDGSALIASTTLGALTDTYSYDDFGAIATYTVKHGTTTLYSLGIAQRDDLGRVTHKTETESGSLFPLHTTYTYDAANRLSSEQSTRLLPGLVESYPYDHGQVGNGNRTDGLLPPQYDAQDRLTSRGLTNYTYDNAGELTASGPVGLPTSKYVYNAAGTLRAATVNGTTIKYLIDGTGRRIGRVPASGSSPHQGYIYRNGYQIAAVLDASNNLEWRFAYVTGRYTPDYAMDAAGTRYRIVTDQVGSVRLVVNAATGSVYQETVYNAWGEATDVVTPTGNRLPLGFAGGLTDPTTNLVHFGAREYDPSVGRWTSKDPTLFGGGLNMYAYAGDDPVNRVDSTGLAVRVPDGQSPTLTAIQASGVGFLPEGGLVFEGIAAAATEVSLLGVRWAPYLPFPVGAAMRNCGSSNGIQVARAACPDGDCLKLSQAYQLANAVGGQLIQLQSRGDRPLPARAGLFETQVGYHVAVLLPDGSVADPLLGVTFADVDAFILGIVDEAALATVTVYPGNVP